VVRKTPWFAILFCATVAFSGGPVGAQSILNGSVSGVIRAEGTPLRGVSISLQSLDLGLTRALSTDGDGRFAVPFVAPGRYEIRAEAFGYRPVVLTGIVVTAGATAVLDVEVQPAQGVVQSIDSVTAVGGRGGARLGNGGLRVSADDLSAVPGLDDGVHGAAALLSTADGTFGQEGLPGSMSVVWVDGVPLRTAGNPLSRGSEIGSPALFRSSLGALTNAASASDVEFGGGPAGYINVASGTGIPRGGAALYAAGSGKPLWSSTEVDLVAPNLTSTWARGAISVPVAADTSRLVLFGDFQRSQLPVPARASSSEAVAGLGEDLASTLRTPSVESTLRASGHARLDWWFTPTQRFVLRAAGGHFERTFEGPGRPLQLPGDPGPMEATDASLSVALVTRHNDRLTIEARGGIAGSSRSYGPAASTPRALLAATGLQLGDAGGGSPAASRIDVFFSPVGHYSLGQGRLLKAGIQVRAARNTITGSSAGGGDYLFADADALSQGRGSFVRTASPESSFATSELGAFAQYQWEAAPGLKVRIGGRYDSERIPSEAAFNSDWLIASGLRNDSTATSFAQIAGRFSLDWDVLGDGRSTVAGAVSMHHGDLGWSELHQYYAQDGASTVSRLSGAGAAWPNVTEVQGVTTLPGLTLMGPDMQPPRTIRGNLSLAQDLGSGWSIVVDGSTRRTDFLMRRRNLNLAVLPAGSDVFGRVLLGDLQKDGAAVTALPGSNRRFPGFDNVWALDPDGWSEYRGGTVGLDYQGDDARFFASYTRSETTDNWFGAAASSPEAELVPVFDEDDKWAESISDFDRPHRLAAFASIDLGPATVSGVYRYESAAPFTPSFRAGVDANGDGSGLNDPAFVPDIGSLGGLASAWPCLQSRTNRMAARNGCRGTAAQTVDARLELQATTIGSRSVVLSVDALGLLESRDGFRDTALLLVDPSQPLTVSAQGDVITIPTIVNPDFGSVILPFSRGRVLRIGVRISGGSR